MFPQHSPPTDRTKSRATRQNPREGLTEASASGRTLSQEDVTKKGTKKAEGEELKNFIASEISGLREEIKQMNVAGEIKKIKEEMNDLKLETKNIADDLKNDLKKEISEILFGLSKEMNEKIKNGKVELDERLKPVEKALNQQTGVIKDLEDLAETSAHTTAKLVTENQRLTDMLVKINDKCTELEGRQRRQNLRIAGIPEGEEKDQDIREFTANLLQKVLSLDQKPQLARAHRVMRRQTGVGAPPRQMIIKVQNDYVVEEIMQKASRNRKLDLKGHRISIYRDYPAEVARKRKAFNETKSILREVADLKYGVSYPATLRVTYDKKEHFFTDPVKALDFAKKIIP
ncbi:uncharacterized protein LOC144601118 [Rhinoraja longicauda]